ncbi:MAG: response regulator [Candidatus Neomarinimicrobiota bacterium]
MIDKKVLFVEDSPTMRRIIMNTLARLNITDVIEAENGKDALEKLGNQEIGLVLTDWNMPEMNGEQLVVNLRKDPNYQEVPIVMITTRGMKEDVMTAMKIGVNGYVIKPFTPEVLKQKIEQIIS